MYSSPLLTMARKSIQVRLDEKLKKRAEALFASLGLDLPTAIRMFFVKAVMKGGIPFDLLQEQKEDHYSKEQLRRIDESYEESLDPKNLSPAFTSADDLIASLRS